MGIAAGALVPCVALLAATAGPPSCDVSGYRPQPGLEAVAENDGLTLAGMGSGGRSSAPGLRP